MNISELHLALDAGHCKTGADTGAQGCNLKEENLTREVANQVSLKIQARGGKITICNTDYATDIAASLSYRSSTANKSNANIFTSIHFNHNEGRPGTGTEIYTTDGVKMPEAVRVLNNLIALGFEDRGIKDGSRLHVIRRTKMKAMLIEVCFINNPKDISLYKALGPGKIADAIVAGILGEPFNATKPINSNEIKKTQPRKQTIDKGRTLLIKRLQQEINSQGFGSLSVDGIPGEKTLAAVPMCKKGAKGNITKIIQEMLINMGYINFLSPYGADCVYGTGTENAVKHFQKTYGLSVDGIMGQKTWQMFFKKLN
ncbi:N-acetylmuramoyl-L-alanine amidase [Hathewaya massiliensis]|uniref:N-acetylmuramoyl-L-alanine amidase n=1 Tax=Hathewaya massiliensis TaxID=1964382 RepID=UPI0011588DFF|nr:N-acetylmuramoyl-L-alanine amidase [Hathewaya massiliensis]